MLRRLLGLGASLWLASYACKPSAPPETEAELLDEPTESCVEVNPDSEDDDTVVPDPSVIVARCSKVRVGLEMSKVAEHKERVSAQIISELQRVPTKTEDNTTAPADANPPDLGKLRSELDAMERRLKALAEAEILRDSGSTLSFAEKCKAAGGVLKDALCQCGAQNSISESIFTDKICREMVQQHPPTSGTGGNTTPSANKEPITDARKTEFRTACQDAKGKVLEDSSYVGSLACDCGGGSRYSVDVYMIYLADGDASGFTKKCNESVAKNGSPSTTNNSATNNSSSANCERKAATLAVTVNPATARLFVDGRQVSTSGATRTFQTPPLCIDRTYNYTLSLNNGSSTNVSVRGGRKTTCTLPNGGCKQPQ